MISTLPFYGPNGMWQFPTNHGFVCGCLILGGWVESLVVHGDYKLIRELAMLPSTRGLGMTEGTVD